MHSSTSLASSSSHTYEERAKSYGNACFQDADGIDPSSAAGQHQDNFVGPQTSCTCTSL